MPRKKTTAKKQTLLKRLNERRIPQIIFIYFGVCWTILEFLSWLVEHYQISPYLTDLGLITLMSMLPTVGLLAYFHGKPGRDEWTRTEKVGIPINIFFTAVLIFIIFSGKELGSATTQVTVKNDLGQVIKRNIPKGDFNRRVAIFFFQNKSRQPQLDWLQSAFMMGCHIDLLQDPVFSLYSAYDNVIYQKILQAGLNSAVGLPMSLEKKIATEIQREYFLGGSFTIANDTIVVSTYLYETDNGKLLVEHIYRDPDFFTIVDQITRQLKDDLGLPAWQIESTEDLPVSALMTADRVACHEYFIGSDLVNLKNDYQNATVHFEKAISSDPTFTLAYWMLYSCYLNTNRSRKAQSALQMAIQHIYKVPELLRFAIKQEHYLVTENPDKRFAVAEMWVQLYPRDIRGHFSLAAEYLKRNEPDRSIEEYRTVMKLDPTRLYYLQYIGDIYRWRGDFKNALKYCNQYKEECPKDYRAFTAFGDLYFTMGNFETARQYYSDALIIDPNDITSAVQLGNVALESGQVEQAYQNFQSALQQARTAAEKAEVYNALQDFYERTGQIRLALNARDDKFRAQAEYVNPTTLALNKIMDQSLKYYCLTGNPAGALAYLKQIEDHLADPWNKMAAAGYLEIYTATGQVEASQSAALKMEDAIRIFGNYNQSDLLYHARGQICEMKNDYIGAVMEYQKEINLVPTAVTVLIDIARCYLMAGDPAKARGFLTTTLKNLPNHPSANLEMARVCKTLGESNLALKYVQTALKIWQNADPDYAPARTARTLAAQLTTPAS